jgi:hypothetical protein
MSRKTGRQYLIQFFPPANQSGQFDYYPAPLMFFDPYPTKENVFETAENQEILLQFFTGMYKQFFGGRKWPRSMRFTKEEWLLNEMSFFLKIETDWFRMYKEFEQFDNTPHKYQGWTNNFRID